MGNCTSCVTSDIKVNDYACNDNALHIMTSVHGDGDRKVGSVYSEKGAKGANQDAAVLLQGYGLKDGSFCGVFDGHGEYGHVVSRVVRNLLPSLLMNQRKFLEWEEAFVSAFKAMDKEIKLQANVDCSLSGSTAVVVVKQGEDLIIGNLGDSRVVLGTLNTGVQAIQLSVDLKPDLPLEADRIKRSNGRVFAHLTQPHIQRVWFPDEDVPGLAMSRAFGDFDMKSYGIIVTPVVSVHRLTSQDQFLVLACDGVWDVLSNEEVASIVWSTENKENAAKAVVDGAVTAWAHKFPKAKIDDCSVVCLFLQKDTT